MATDERAFFIIVPAADAPAMRLFLETLGYGPGGIGIGLSATGAAPATHYGTNDSSMSQDGANVLSAFSLGTVPGADKDGNPIDWEGGPITEEDAQALATGGTVSITQHTNCDVICEWGKKLEAVGLQVINTAPPDL